MRKPVPGELEARLAGLPALDYLQLRDEWRRAYRALPPPKLGRDLLELGIAWKLQEQALGGLSGSSLRRLADLDATMAAKGDLAQARATKLRPGARLMRAWGGVTHDVTVLEEGFLWQGTTWPSLSAIATAITGAHWSGPRFFGLTAKRRETVDA